MRGRQDTWNRSRRAHLVRAAAGWGLVCVVCEVASGQDLTPRAYWPAPHGTKVAIVGYSHVRGDVLFDPSVPLYGVDSKIRTGIAAYLRTFSLFGRTANVVAELPYSWGTTRGLVEDTLARRDFSGLGDLGVTLSVNLLGAPTMTPADFQAHLIHRFKPGFWASLDATYFTGGRQTIGGDELVDVLHNSRVGAMVVFPFKGRHALKFGYFLGVRTEFGSDFDQLLVSYQVLIPAGAS